MFTGVALPYPIRGNAFLLVPTVSQIPSCNTYAENRHIIYPYYNLTPFEIKIQNTTRITMPSTKVRLNPARKPASLSPFNSFF